MVGLATVVGLMGLSLGWLVWPSAPVSPQQSVSAAGQAADFAQVAAAVSSRLVASTASLPPASTPVNPVVYSLPEQPRVARQQQNPQHRREGVFGASPTGAVPAASGLTRATGLQVQGLAASPNATTTRVATVRIWTPSADYLARYQLAAQLYCPTAGWPLLAAIGQVESGHGATMGPSWAGALGPMQFMPATWQGMVAAGQAVDGNSDGRFDLLNPDDAIPTAAVKLCQDGATSPRGSLTALWHYNHSSSYVAVVAQLAHAYSATYPSLPPAPLPATATSSGRTLEQARAQTAVTYSLASSSLEVARAALLRTARSYLGVPYVWGGTDPRIGVDCSGLIQLVYGQHGVALPRVSADQARAGLPVASLAQAQPGDLVAFGDPVDHIGIYLGQGLMLHAPNPGAVVTITPIKGLPTALRRVLTPGVAAAVALSPLQPVGTSTSNTAQTQVVSIFPPRPQQPRYEWIGPVATPGVDSVSDVTRGLLR